MKKTRYFIRLANAENFFKGKFIKNEKYEYFLVIKIKGSLMAIRKIKNINGAKRYLKRHKKAIK